VTVVGVAGWGPLVTTVDVDGWVLAHLEKWLPTYLTKVERERDLRQTGDRPFLERPHRYRNVLLEDEFLDEDLPLVAVTSSTGNNVTSDGEGFVSAELAVVVTVVLRGQDAENSKQNAALYEGSVRRLLLDKPDLDREDGLVGVVSCDSFRVAPVADVSGEGRYLCAGMNAWTVAVDKINKIGSGPLDPDLILGTDPTTDPEGTFNDLPSVADVTVAVGALPIEEET